MRIVPLAELTEEISKKNKNDEVLPVYSVTNSEGFMASEEYFSKQVFSKNLNTYKIVEKGDFAYNPSRINVGSIDYFKNESKGLISPLYVTFRTKYSLDDQFLKYFLKSNYGIFQIRNNTSGSVRDTLSYQRLAKIKVPLYDLDIQKAIVKKLDIADRLRQKRKQTIDLLDEYLKSVFLKMFGDPALNPKGWEKMTGEKYSELLTVGVVIKPASYYKNSGVIALRSLNVKPNKIDLSNIVYFSYGDNNEKLAKSKLKEGDVVVVRTGLTGTAAVIPKELDGVNCIDLIIVRPKKELVNSVYLCFLLNSDIGKQLISQREVGGIQKHFNVGSIKKLELPIPNIDLQNKFENVVRETMLLKRNMENQSIELDNQFNALMQKSFEVN